VTIVLLYLTPVHDSSREREK